MFLSGDSHANWVSDLVWHGAKPYDKVSGKGAIGVEFAGTAVASGSLGPLMEEYNKKAKKSVEMNEELQWAETCYRGYFELQISPKKIVANYFGLYSLPPLLHFSFLALQSNADMDIL